MIYVGNAGSAFVEVLVGMFLIYIYMIVVVFVFSLHILYFMYYLIVSSLVY